MTDATLLADTRTLDLNGASSDEFSARHALPLQAVMARRRSIRRLAPGPFTAEARARLLEAIRLTPAAYNLPPWRVVLVHERREELWEEIAAGFREELEVERLGRYLERLEGFRDGVAVALIFEDRRVERVLREEKGASPEIARSFVQQGLGMVQMALWLAITAEGLATSLQHWDELVGARVKRFAGLAVDDYTLVATMPIGYAGEEPRAIERAAGERLCAVDPNGAGDRG